MNQPGRFFLTLTVLLLLTWTYSNMTTAAEPQPIGLALHGGTLSQPPGSWTPEREQAYREKLSEAALAGHAVLQKGGSSLDAVEATIRILEDSPLFNAGKGAVFTAEGTHELDASIMDGRTRNAGAVAAVRHIKNPITHARLVMEKSPHVLLVGEGAEVLAKQHQLEFVQQAYYSTDEQRQNLERAQKLEKLPRDGRQSLRDEDADLHFGTVGCVALDRQGNLAAGTSTGGRTNKKFGRVGDSPIIGAGTYANNRTCAVSATGHGEFFIRGVVTYDISALMEYKALPLSEAVETVIQKKLGELGGTGGVIAMDAQGKVAMSFNTPGMFRAHVTKEGKAKVEFYK